MPGDVKKATGLPSEPSLTSGVPVLTVLPSTPEEIERRNAKAKAKADTWRAENADAIESCNKWVAKNGLPLERYRLF